MNDTPAPQAAPTGRLAAVERHGLILLAVFADTVLAVGDALNQVPHGAATKWGAVLTVGLGLAHGIKEGLPATARALGQPAVDDGSYAADTQQLAQDVAGQAKEIVDEHLKVAIPTTIAQAAGDAQAAERAAADVDEDRGQAEQVVTDARELADPPPVDDAHALGPDDIVDAAPPAEPVTLHPPGSAANPLEVELDDHTPRG